MPANYSQYTQSRNEVYTQSQLKINDRFQADYDYNGEFPRDEDIADLYAPIKAVRLA